MAAAVPTAEIDVLGPGAVDSLIALLRGQGFAVVGPTVRDGVVVYEAIASESDLPRGWTDEQSPGRYRLRANGDGALFACHPGAASLKRFLHPPELTLSRVVRDGDSFRLEPAAKPPRPLAVVGARPCELAAMAIQDHVLLDGPYTDAGYAGRRADMFVAVVECTEAGGTCFCAAMGTGPGARAGFDLALTETVAGGARLLLARAGSEHGRAVLATLPRRPAEANERAAGEEAVARAACGQRDVPRPEDLASRYDHPRFEEVARRCLGCASCTLVCPTCFCTTMEDACALDGTEAVRTRRWDSCFTPEFSYLHGGSVRTSLSARWRHWAMHKFVTWHDQFGGSGCVGCGRCITWCPAGIDLVEELHALAGVAGQGGVA